MERSDGEEDKEAAVEEAIEVEMEMEEGIAGENREKTLIQGQARRRLQLEECRRQLARHQAPTKRLRPRRHHHQRLRRQLRLSQEDRLHRRRFRTQHHIPTYTSRRQECKHGLQLDVKK